MLTDHLPPFGDPQDVNALSRAPPHVLTCQAQLCEGQHAACHACRARQHHHAVHQRRAAAQPPHQLPAGADAQALGEGLAGAQHDGLWRGRKDGEREAQAWMGGRDWKGGTLQMNSECIHQHMLVVVLMVLVEKLMKQLKAAPAMGTGCSLLRLAAAAGTQAAWPWGQEGRLESYWQSSSPGHVD